MKNKKSMRIPGNLFALCMAFGLFFGLSCGGFPPDTSEEPTAHPSPSPSPVYVFEQAWEDQFDQSTIDTNRWIVQDHFENWWADTMPWRRNYKASNVYTADVEGAQDGKALVIRTIKETAEDGSVSYSTGCVQSGEYGSATHPFAQVYGRFEARVKFPTQQGHWPAFWLFTDRATNVDGSGTDGTEIDIMEKAFLEDKTSHALHWDGYDSAHRSAFHEVTGMGMDDGGWHTFRVDWYPDQYVFFVDGVETWRSIGGGVSTAPSWIIISEEIGYITGWGDGPIDAATLPDYYYIDWVRVSTCTW